MFIGFGKWRFGVWLLKRKQNYEQCSSSIWGLYPDGAPVRSNNVLSNRQPQTGAGHGIAGRGRPVKTFEDPRSIGFCYSGAVILKAKKDLIALSIRRNLDC